MRPTAGVTFGGRYELVSRIAIGGMGEVWQATDSVIGRTVAIKILKDEYLGDPNFLERFRSEARHAALVNHEGIANVYDYGEEDGSAFLVMELVPGEALSTVLERERVLPSDKVLDIVAQTALALQAAHSAGLVHRDIKPGNLLITPDGRVKITDFGIARIADQVPLTATGQVMGTVQYLSPEQASGHPASPSTDIYSLGIVAYESLAGKRPFTGESQVAIAMAQINEAPPALPATIAEPVRNLVFSMIAKNPADRPASAAHVARAAQALRHGDLATATAAVPAIADGFTATQATQIIGATDAATTLLATASTTVLGADGEPIEEEGTKKKKSPWLWPLIALIAVLAIVLGVVVYSLLNPSEDTAKPAETSSTPAENTETAEPPVDDSVFINANDYVGKPASEVMSALTQKGLKPELVTGSAATDSSQLNTVESVAPAGNLTKGASITVTQYGPLAEIQAPSTSPTVECAEGKCVTGTEAKVSWSAGSLCPAGLQTSGYRLSVSGATLKEKFPGGAISPNVTSATIVLGGAPGPAQISYVVMCGDNRESAPSPIAVVPIQAAPTTPPAADNASTNANSTTAGTEGTSTTTGSATGTSTGN